MAKEKYEKMKIFLDNKDVINKPITINEIEKYLKMNLPKSYYTKSYWNNSNYGIGKILYEKGLRVKSITTVIEFEKIKTINNKQKVIVER